MKQPVGGDPDLAIETGHLHQVNATPQKPCQQSRELNAKNLRDGGAVSERAECSKAFEPEFRPPAAAHGGGNINRSGDSLTDRVLGRRWNLCPGNSLDCGTVTQCPDLAFVILQLQVAIDEQLTSILRAVEILHHRRKRRWHSGYQRLARD